MAHNLHLLGNMKEYYEVILHNGEIRRYLDIRFLDTYYPSSGVFQKSEDHETIYRIAKKEQNYDIYSNRGVLVIEDIPFASKIYILPNFFILEDKGKSVLINNTTRYLLDGYSFIGSFIEFFNPLKIFLTSLEKSAILVFGNLTILRNFSKISIMKISKDQVIMLLDEDKCSDMCYQYIEPSWLHIIITLENDNKPLSYFFSSAGEEVLPQFKPKTGETKRDSEI